MTARTHPAAPHSSDTRSIESAHIVLLGGFAVVANEEAVELPVDAQRLTAFLALHRRRLPRAFVAGMLWIDGSQARAFGNLRSTLWRLRQRIDTLVDADADSLVISSAADIDIDNATLIAARLGDESCDCTAADYAIEPFLDELLPGWYDEWVVVERERIRQQSLHALEAIASRLVDDGDYAGAIQAALAAINLDPLRESAHRCLIRVDLAEGNRSEAIRHYGHYATLLHDQLGLEPSEHMVSLLS